MNPSLYVLNYRGDHNSNQRIVLVACGPEEAQEFGSEILTERKTTNWKFQSCESIRAFIAPGAESVLVKEAIGTTA